MKRRIASVVAGLSLVVASGWLQAAPRADQELVFRVLLDDSEIGYHRFHVMQREQQQVIDIDARFKVTFLGIPVYRYDHRNRETWRQGCLESIVSTTEDGGDDFRVDGRDTGAQFEVSTLDGAAELDAGCVMSFAYWDRDFLRQNRLLNAQNGEYLAVEITAEGVEELQVNDRTVSASRHRLVNSEQEIDITVWHALEDGRWLSLESRVDGRVISYRLANREQVEALRSTMQVAAGDDGAPAKRESGR